MRIAMNARFAEVVLGELHKGRVRLGARFSPGAAAWHGEGLASRNSRSQCSGISRGLAPMPSAFCRSGENCSSPCSPATCSCSRHTVSCMASSNARKSSSVQMSRQAIAISTIKGIRPRSSPARSALVFRPGPSGHNHRRSPAPWMSCAISTCFNRGCASGLAWTGSIIRRACLKRLWAIDAFFQQFPQYRGRFTFIQIAVPTRGDLEAYRQYRELIRETVNDINMRYGSISHSGTPRATRWRLIELREGRIGMDTLAAYYRMADLALVSSVYDGMNLVAKEYVASQVDEKGVLLVSHMAGAAEEMTDALVINPYDPEGVADSIRQALEMPLEQRRDRMHRMRAYLAAHDIRTWADDCFARCGESFPS